jgi:DNA repair protein RadC
LRFAGSAAWGALAPFSWEVPVNNILVNDLAVNNQMIDSQTVSGNMSVKSAKKSLARENLSSRRSDNKTLKKKRLSGSTLKNHLKYIVPELKLALIKEPGVKPHAIHGPQEIERLIEPMKFYPEEHFVAFHLDTKFQVIGYNEVSKGTVSASLVHPREVFKAALLSNSTAIICAHNHPSGVVKPSNEDIETTITLIKAGQILGVLVLDHVIIGGDELFSLRENRPDLWL